MDEMDVMAGGLGQRETPVHQVYLGLGSNLGDRDALLRAAITALSAHAQVTVERVSSVFDTAPLLVTDQPRFHNIACAGRTRLDALGLLRLVKDTEASLGRMPGRRYGPRSIDIDILVFDNLRMQTPELTIPHPGIAERTFVLAPLAEIAPKLRVPGLDVDVETLLARLPGADVQRVGPLFGVQS
jgi:2-amino-4-hydroxy-6-hydroxymethyldihydropteridine diphosphokinase